MHSQMRMSVQHFHIMWAKYALPNENAGPTFPEYNHQMCAFIWNVGRTLSRNVHFYKWMSVRHPRNADPKYAGWWQDVGPAFSELAVTNVGPTSSKRVSQICPLKWECRPNIFASCEPSMHSQMRNVGPTFPEYSHQMYAFLWKCRSYILTDYALL